MLISNFVHARGLDFANAMSVLARANYEIDATAKGALPGEGVLKDSETTSIGQAGNQSIHLQKNNRSLDVSTGTLFGATSATRANSLARLQTLVAGNLPRDGMPLPTSQLPMTSTAYELLPSRALFLTLALAAVVDSALEASRSLLSSTDKKGLDSTQEVTTDRLSELQLDIATIFEGGRFGEPFIANLASLPLSITEDLSPLLYSIANFAAEVIRNVSEALAKGYVTFLNQIEENYEAFASLLDTISSPAGFKISAYLLELDMPEGPRTPTFNIPLLGAGIDGDTNTIKFMDVENLSLFGSLTEKGDPSDQNPDRNDLSGQVEADVAGLLVGANFQNGIYVGSYAEETESSEAHHQFQTGMVDQSGPYVFGDRLDSLNSISINPEAAQQNDSFIVGDLIPFDLSVEGISAFLDSQEREYVLPKTDFRTYEEILDGVIASSEIRLSEIGFNLDPAITESSAFESIDLDSILSVASTVEMASMEAAEMMVGSQVQAFDLSSYLGGLKGFGPGEQPSFGSNALGEGGVL